ncbi:BID domain-containing T4SS effector [Bartonella quintana]|nr:BID domain-containing T4SS effector [Bartonella quintana]SQF96431.1 Protein involved in cell division [Bartonella quintana]
MKKNQPAPSAPLSVKELKKRYEQPATRTPFPETLSARISPKDKRQPSPKLEELKKRYEHPPTETSSSESLSATVAPQRPLRMKEKLAKMEQTRETADAKIVPPQRPPRMKDKLAQMEQARKTADAKIVPPQRPPRMKDKLAKIEQAREIGDATAAPPKPPRMKDKLAKIEQAREIGDATAAPPKPPRMKDKLAKMEQTRETADAMAAPPKPPRMKARGQSSIAAESETLYATAAPQKPLHMRKTLVNTMEQKLLIDAYQEEIRYWCRMVYGDRLILDERMEEVQKNPALGEQLSREVAENPQSIAQFAGKKMLGLKTKARREAEENFSSLCATLEGYVYTVKYSQETTMHVPHAEQRHHEEPTQRGQRAENLRKPLHPEKEMAPLSNKEIAHKIQKDPSVQYAQAEVCYWCKITYGDPSILQERIEEIQKIPGMGEELSWQVANHPTFFHKLAGRQMLGIKNQTRKKAEEGLSTLCSAIENYADVVKQVRDNIVQTHQAQQNCQEQSVELAQDLQKQQALSKRPKLPEHSTVTARHEGVEASRQAQQQSPDVRPRKVGAAKAMAFAS